MYQELMFEAVKDRQARVRADIRALNDHRVAHHPVRSKVGALMVRMGQRLQALSGEDLTMESSSGVA